MKKINNTTDVKEMFFSFLKDLERVKRQLRLVKDLKSGFQAMETISAWLDAIHEENFVCLLEETLYIGLLEEKDSKTALKRTVLVQDQIFQLEFLFKLHLGSFQDLRRTTLSVKQLTQLAFLDESDSIIIEYSHRVNFIRSTVLHIESILVPLIPILEEYFYFEDQTIEVPASYRVFQLSEQPLCEN